MREFALRPMGDFFTGVGPYVSLTNFGKMRRINENTPIGCCVKLAPKHTVLLETSL